MFKTILRKNRLHQNKTYSVSFLLDIMHKVEEKIHNHLYNFLNDEHIEYILEDQNNFLPLNINLMMYLIP